MRVAAIDVGTNSVRLLALDGDGTELSRRMQITRLGQGVDQTRALHPDAIARTLRVLGEYKSELHELGIERLRVTGTSAVRDASNRSSFVNEVSKLLGTAPEVLSGTEEARLCFEGTIASFRSATPPYLVVDIGGGSTEFVLGKDAPEHLVSLDVGCVRVTERFGLSSRPSRAQLGDAHATVRGLLAAATAQVPFDEARTWVGVAGTITTFAALDARLAKYDPSVTHGYRLEASRFEALYEELMDLSLAGLELRLFDPARAPVMLGGAVVLGEIFRHFALEAIVVSERDILDGLANSLRVPSA